MISRLSIGLWWRLLLRFVRFVLFLIIIKYIFCLQRSKNKVQTLTNVSNICLIFHDFLSLTFILQVDLYLLPQAAFPTGGLYFKNKTWVKETKGKHVIIHNNYIIGFEKKTKRFRDYGLWLVDDHALESPLGRIWLLEKLALLWTKPLESQYTSCLLTPSPYPKDVRVKVAAKALCNLRVVS